MPTFNEQDYEIDLRLVQRASRRCARSYQNEMPDVIAERVFERLSLLKIKPQRVLDLGAGNTRHRHRLKALYPDATVISLDVSLDMLGQADRGRFWQRKPFMVCADATANWPFADASFDLIFSNLMLPWVHPADEFAAELNRVLSAQGAFFVSSAGPDTLIELRNAWAAIDSAAHVNALIDMHDLGDVFMRAGIADPVMDAERLQLNYSSVEKLLNELRSTGALNVLAGRRRGLTAATVRDRLAACYPVNTDGGITATLEAVFAHGWKGEPKTSGNAPTEFFVSLESLTTPEKRRKSGKLAK